MGCKHPRNTNLYSTVNRGQVSNAATAYVRGRELSESSSGEGIPTGIVLPMCANPVVVFNPVIAAPIAPGPSSSWTYAD